MTQEPEQLSEREEEILALLNDGKSNREIAQELGLSLTAVRRSVRTLLAKLRLESSAPPGADTASGQRPPEQLSPREEEVLALLAEGRNNKAIAAELGLSPSTVKGYIESILRKLDVTSRTGAVAVWLRRQRE